MTTSRDAGTQHKLRMPPELKEQLFESAKEMNRSLNAEIVSRLEKSFDRQELNQVQTIDLIMELVARFPKETFTLNLDDNLRKEMLENKKKAP